MSSRSEPFFGDGCVLVPRVNSVFFALTKLLEHRDFSKIFFPANFCFTSFITLQSSISYSALDSCFDTFNVDLVNIRVESNSIYIIPFLYGLKPSGISDFIETAHAQRSIVCIDLAQSPISRAEVDLLAPEADIICWSFGDTKQLSLGGFGVYACRDEDVSMWISEEIESAIVGLQYLDEEVPNYSETYKDYLDGKITPNTVYQNFFGTITFGARSNLKRYQEWCECTRQKFIRNTGKLALDRKLRIQYLQNFDRLIESLIMYEELTFPHRDSVVYPWRFSFLCDPNLRDTLLEEIRKSAQHSSAYYPVYDRSFATDCPDSCANQIHSRIINLWIDPRFCDQRYLNACTSILRRYIGKK